MRDTIARRLEKIETLFSHQRIEKSKQRWTNLLYGKGKIDRLPYVALPATAGTYVPAFHREERLIELLDDIITRGALQDDYIPSLFTGCRQTTIPTMFGAVEFPIGDDVGCHPILKSEEEIVNLPEPSIKEGSTAKYWLEMEEYFVTETEGRLPVHVTDMQGPFDVVGQIWGYADAFPLAYENPALYNTLMNRLADAYILLWNAQKDLLGDLFIGTHLFGWDWVPLDFGASMSVDSLVMLSPAFYDAYYRPVIERIADNFGKISLHSCGNFAAVVKNICATKGVFAINASQMNLQELANSGMTNDKIAILITPFEEVASTLATSKESGIALNLSVSNVFNGSPYTMWTPQDYDRVKKVEDFMNTILSN